MFVGRHRLETKSRNSHMQESVLFSLFHEAESSEARYNAYQKDWKAPNQSHKFYEGITTNKIFSSKSW